jgi:hypothetical protein
MAGPKKNHSRNSAASRPAPASSVPLIIPCNGGRNAYVRSAVTGSNPNLSVGSAAFNLAIAENMNAGNADKIRDELLALDAAHPGHNWAGTLADLRAAGVIAGA